MAVSSIFSGSTYGSTSTATRLPTTACPTCGGNAARTSTARAFSGSTYTGRGTDAFVCATCGQQRSTVASASSTASTTTSRTSLSSASSYCPTCGNNPSINTGLSRAVYSGSSQTSGTSNTYGKVSCATCSSAASRVAAANVNTISWAR